MNMHVYIHSHICMYPCIYIHTHILCTQCIYIFTHTCTDTYPCTYIHTCKLFAQTHKCIYYTLDICVYMYVC